MSEKRLFNPTITDTIPEIMPEELMKFLDKGNQAGTGQAPDQTTSHQITLIDVRRPEEFTGELSHIPGAKLITLGPDFDAFLKSHNKNDEIVFICRSGARSGHATLQSQAEGYKKCVNLRGGMLLWNERKFPLDRNN